jgi:hypothetical protein
VIGGEPALTPLGSRETSASAGGADNPDAEARASRGSIHTDIVIAGVILAFCALMWAGTLAFDEVPAAVAQGMGPAAVPRLILSVIILLTLWLAWTARGRPDRKRQPVPGVVYQTGIAVLVFMGIVKLFGIYAAIVFAVLGIGRLWGERRWWLMAAVGIGLAVATHLVFVMAFKMSLPRSIVGYWLE